MSKHKKSLAKSKPNPPTKTDSSPFVPQRSKLDWGLTIRERKDLREKQKAIIDLVLDKQTKVVFIKGPAGTSKTWLAVYCGLLLLQQHRISHITFVRTLAESASKGIGFLPGELEAKLDPFLKPLLEKLEELLPANEIKRLQAEDRVVGLPINFARGASMNAQCIIVEEAQNFDLGELTTILTRIGQYSKMIIAGDESQSDINGKSAFLPFFDWFNQPSYQEKGIHCVSLTTEDIVRSGIVREIVEAIEAFKANRAANSAPR